MEIADALNSLLAGQKALWLIVTALVLALLMFRLTHALVYAAIGVLLHFFGPLAWRFADGADLSVLQDEAGSIAAGLISDPLPVAILYLIYLALIGILYTVKSVLIPSR